MLPQLTHVGVYSINMAEMERFYTTLFGMEVTDRGEVERLDKAKVVFLSADINSHHQLVLIEWPAGRPECPSTVNQLSFKVQHLAQLRRIHALLEAEGCSIKPVDHGNAWSVYSTDPDGNGIEIYMDTQWYVAQPHGRPLDLTLTDEALMKATEAAVLADPTCLKREEWQKQLSKRLDERRSSQETDFPKDQNKDVR